MDNAADWIYLLIGLVAAVMSIISSAKKKRQTPGKVKKQVKPVIVTTKEKVQTKRPLTFLEQKELQGDLPGDKRTRVEVMDTASLQQSAENEYNLADFDELKKAVIYSEILNRKY